MFDGSYFDWNQKRIKGIVDFYGYKFFYMKRVLDLGCGYADMGGVLHRLGADITAVDARQEHLKVVTKKFAGIKTTQADLDGPWPFFGQKFELILDLGILCHLSNFESHLKSICASTTHLVLETAVCDSNDPTKCIKIEEAKGSYDLSYNGVGCRPSPAAIERVLSECGMNFKRVINSRYNSGEYSYDWAPQNDGSTSLNKRAIWFAIKSSSPIQFKNPESDNPTLQQIPDFVPDSPMGFVHSVKSSGIPAKVTASPRVPISHRLNEAERGVVTESAPSSRILIEGSGGSNYNSEDKKFVIVIPSYKNQQWYEKNIQSALNQNYTNYRVIFTDDCSPDETFNKVSQMVGKSPNANRVTLIKNDRRIGALANLYNMIHSCNDDEIILTLDGDDWLANDNVLNRLNKVYSDNQIWMTYGQYQNSNDKQIGCAQQYPDRVVASNGFRHHAWGATHLRTFYTWLFKSIKKEDLMYQGDFYPMTWDFAIMFPMLEMSGPHSKFLSDILYIYNLENPINDHKVNVKLQQSLDRELRNKPKYQKVGGPSPATPPPPPKTKIGLLLIATAKYSRFVQGMISSADKFFLNSENVTYYVFSDQQLQIESQRNVVQIRIEHKSFPFASMDRFKHFTNNSDITSNEDYLYYVDVDCLFVDRVGKEILGDLVGVRHCGFIDKRGPYEENPKSCLFIGPNYPKSYRNYYGGGFSGGKTANYLELSKWCYEHIEQDVANGVIPIWHDETALNRYFVDHEPTVILTPEYHYPQANLPRYKKMWGNQNWRPKILLLEKNHNEVRG